MKTVLFGMGKMESQYIEEWVIYHLKLGIDNIYIYDNEDTPTYEKILINFRDKVKVLHLPGIHKIHSLQTVVLHHFQQNYIRMYDYAIHLDIDEFLCLKKHDNINEFINEYFIDKTLNALCINWVFFGSNNLKINDRRGVLERFTKCQEGTNQHIKLIVNVKYLEYYLGPHKIKGLKKTYTKDTNSKIIEGTFNEKGPNNIIQINHYKVKSEEEFKKVVSRPRPDKSLNAKDRFRNNFDKEFNAYNLNDIEDLHAYYFYKFN